MKVNLTTIKCAKCGSRMLEVIHAEANRRKGWWCKDCKHWVKTIGREKFLQE